MPNWCAQGLTFTTLRHKSSRQQISDMANLLSEIERFPTDHASPDHVSHTLMSNGMSFPNYGPIGFFPHDHSNCNACWTTVLTPSMPGETSNQHQALFDLAVNKPADKQPRTVGKMCYGCGLTRSVGGEKFLRCSRCKRVCYCGVSCQRADHKHHRKPCIIPEIQHKKREGTQPQAPGRYDTFKGNLTTNTSLGMVPRYDYLALESSSAAAELASAELQLHVRFCIAEVTRLLRCGDGGGGHQVNPLEDPAAEFAYRVLSSAGSGVLGRVVSFIGVQRAFEVTLSFTSKWSPAYNAECIQRIACRYAMSAKYLFAERGEGFKGRIICDPYRMTCDGSACQMTPEDHDAGYRGSDEDEAEFVARENQAALTNSWYDLIVNSG